MTLVAAKEAVVAAYSKTVERRRMLIGLSIGHGNSVEGEVTVWCFNAHVCAARWCKCVSGMCNVSAVAVEVRCNA